MKRRLYIFPALIPLAEILPWLLALIGGVAGVTHHVKRFAANRMLVAIAAACLIAAAGIVTWQWIEKPGAAEGSVLLPATELPKTVQVIEKPPAALPDSGDGLAVLWAAPSPHEYLSEIVVHDGVVYTGMMNGHLDARNAATGQKLWTMHKRESLYAPLAAGKTHGYQAEGLHTAIYSALTGFTLSGGKAVWERRFRGHLEATPVIDDSRDALYLSAGTQGFWALDAASGKDLWHLDIGHMDVRVLMKDDTLYVPSWSDPDSRNAVFYAIRPDDGHILWQTEVTGRPMEPPLVGKDGHIYLGTAIGQIALDRADDAGWAHAITTGGEILWTRQLETMSIPDMSLLQDKGLLFFSLKNGKLVALSTTDGHTVWEKSFGAAFVSPALLVTDTKQPVLVAKTVRGDTAILDAETGQEIGQLPVAIGGYSAPAYHDGILYIADEYMLYAIGGFDRLIDGKAGRK